jgi:hypothetical protein
MAGTRPGNSQVLPNPEVGPTRWLKCTRERLAEALTGNLRATHLVAPPPILPIAVAATFGPFVPALPPLPFFPLSLLLLPTIVPVSLAIDSAIALTINAAIATVLAVCAVPGSGATRDGKSCQSKEQNR